MDRYYGENHPSAVLTEKKVIKIREMYGSGKYTMAMLARKFDVSPATINSIVTGVSWKHITNGEAVKGGEWHLKGEKHPRAKLTEKQVLAIKKEYAEGNVTQYALAEKYGVSQCRISLIISGKSWKK